eukprot:COSAG02_NODE_332_length_24474_cov_23.190949_18_plen_37_part_00
MIGTNVGDNVGSVECTLECKVLICESVLIVYIFYDE